MKTNWLEPPPWAGRVQVSRNSAVAYRSLQDIKDTKYRAFIEAAAVSLIAKWQPHWDTILAVGPFPQPPWEADSVPMILCGRFSTPAKDLETLSKALAPAYANSIILPDVYLLDSRFVTDLEKQNDALWDLAKKSSFHINPAVLLHDHADGERAPSL